MGALFDRLEQVEVVGSPPGFWVQLYGNAAGRAVSAICELVHRSCAIELIGTEPLAARPNHIFCLWHGGWLPYFIAVRAHRAPHAWLTHPTWQVTPMQVVMKRVGVQKLVMGSAGRNGKAAADQLQDLLRQGYSTVLAPDGPRGPRRTLKRGVLHIAAETGVPIVPVRLETPRALWARSSWDEKRLPLPFSTVRVIFGAPIAVHPSHLDAAAEKLIAGLG